MSDSTNGRARRRDPPGEWPHGGGRGALERMVWIPGGAFVMGSDDHYPEEAPAHRLKVAGFWMDQTSVTNADFRRFVDDTGYVTLAEKPANATDYPDARPELLAPSSVVFSKPPRPVRGCISSVPSSTPFRPRISTVLSALGPSSRLSANASWHSTRR